MTTREIETVLEKYYNGESSLREEHLLKEFFTKENVPAHLQEHQAIFGFFAREEDTALRKNPEAFLQDKKDKGKIIPMAARSKRLYYTLSLAASIVLIAGLITTFQLGLFTPTQPYGTITDPDLAYVEARNALFLVSERFNNGIGQARQLQTFQDGMDRAKYLEMFQNGFSKAEKFNRLEKYQPIILTPDEK